MSKFDRVLWRINGVLILLGCAAFAVMAVWSILGLALYRADARGTSTTTTLSQETQRAEPLRLGAFSRVAGHAHYVAPLRARQDRPGRYARSHSFDPRPVRNYLFYHPDDSTTHWLFDDHASVIKSMDEVVEMRMDQRPKQVTGFLFTTVGARDESGEMTEEEMQTVWASDPMGKSLATVLEGVDNVLRVIQHDDRLLLIFFIRDGRYFAMKLATDFAASEIDELPVPG